MDATAQNAEDRIEAKQEAQDAKAAEAARKAVEAEGGLSVEEFEETSSTIHGI